jgi:hypothetical protein
MDDQGWRQCTPRAPEGPIEKSPFLDLASGYLQRAIDIMPKQGPQAPWRLHQNYPRDVFLLRHSSVTDEAMEFSNPTSRPVNLAPVAA